jgi:cytoskeletal protein CcmA (bactofilin family)
VCIITESQEPPVSGWPADRSSPFNGKKETHVFNRDGLFGKKDENPRSDLRPVNVTPGLSGSGGGGPLRPQPQPQQQPHLQPSAETPRPDLRFTETPKAPVRVEEPAGSRLIVGPDIKLKGVEITDCDTLVVEGRVEASMDSRVVQIAENGVFSGTVSIDVAEIRGTFEGELTARKQLVIYSTGRVSGRIRYGKIRIEEGGEISGEVSTLSSATASSRQPQPAAAAAPAPAVETEFTPIAHEPLTVRPAVKPQPAKSGAGVNTV